MGPKVRVFAVIFLGGMLLLTLLGLLGCDSHDATVLPLSSGTATSPVTPTSSAVTQVGTEASPTSATPTTVDRVELYTADWAYERASLQYLVDSSDVIVRGRVIENPVARWNSPDGKQWTPKDSTEGAQFYTTWIVQAEEVFKGDAWIGAEIPFRFEGGTVEFNGRLAHYVGNDYPEMKEGDEVIICGQTETRIWGVEDLPGFWIPAGFFVFAKGPDGQFHRMVPGGGPEGSDEITPSDVQSVIKDVRAGQIRDYFGLWADNVESLPGKPAALPPHFLTPPQEIEAFTAENEGTPLVLSALGVKTPLWVFADELELTQVGAKITAAMNDERPVVISGADEGEVYPYLPGSEEAVFFTPDVPREHKLIAWVPYQGFRTSTIMDPVTVPWGTTDTRGVQGLTDDEDLYWQMAALTLWRDWHEAWRRKPDAADTAMWPQNRGPFPDELRPHEPATAQMLRWLWQNGGNIISDGHGEVLGIPVPERIPPGTVMPAETVEGDSYGGSRGVDPQDPAFHSWATQWFPSDDWSSNEWQRYAELYQTGLPFYLVQGYDGYLHPAAADDPRIEISPAPPILPSRGTVNWVDSRRVLEFAG